MKKKKTTTLDDYIKASTKVHKSAKTYTRKVKHKNSEE